MDDKSSVLPAYHKPKYIYLLAAIIVAAFLYSFHITSDLYGDEVHTYGVISSGSFLENIGDPGMGNPPLYFFLAKCSYELIGQPWAMRMPSLIFSLGTVLLIAFAARRILGPEYFAIAAWAAALSPYLLEFAAEGRAYAMLIFFSVLAFRAFYEFLQNENRRNMLWLSGMIICGALTHYFFWFQAGFMVLFYLFSKRHITRYSLGVCIIAAALLALVAIMLLLVQKASILNYMNVEWAKEYFSYHNFLARLYIAMSYGYSTFTLPNLDPARNVQIVEVIKNNLALFALVILVFAGFIKSCFRLAKERPVIFWFLLSGIIIPVIAGLVATKAGLFLIREKYLAIIWAPYIMLIVLSFGFMKREKWGLVIIGAYLCIVLVSLYHFTVMPNEYTRRMDWTGLNKTLSQQLSPQDKVLYYCFAPQYLSMGKMTSLEKAGTVINVAVEKDARPSTELRQIAEQIASSTSGNIFIIDNETERNLTDPGNEIYSSLKKGKVVRAERFGRNLALYEFSKP
jgi:4-amino-4-deoxy-L-arabinose transferase-like glycosyltransferase